MGSAKRANSVGYGERRWRRAGTPDARLSGVPTMRSDRLKERWWVGGVVILAALLTLATACCLFGGHGRASHLAQPDLCLGVFVVSLAVISLRPLLAGGWAVRPLVVAAHAVGSQTPDPPPRPALFP